MVDDNFHPMDEDERWTHGYFDSIPEAIDACKHIVESSVQHLYKPGMGPTELIDVYKTFGEDPFVMGPNLTQLPFSAWTYAEEYCIKICKKDRKSHLLSKLKSGLLDYFRN